MLLRGQMHPEGASPDRRDTGYRIACLVAGSALLGLGLVLVLHGALNADEGFYLLASRFVADGLRPYHDFGFTQTPLVLYANVPWLTLFGYDLTGVRLAGLAWSLLSLLLGVLVLRRRPGGWRNAAVFAVLLLGATGWLAFSVKGKTYAFSAFAVLLGTIALTMRGSEASRWTVFIGAAAIAGASRLPTVAFFLPAGIALLAFTPRWSTRVFATGATAVVAIITLALIVVPHWDSFWFWTAQFHAASTWGIHPSLDLKLQALTFAPALWLGVLVAAVSQCRTPKNLGFAALIALLLAALANVLPPSGYGEYVASFIPALAFVVAPILAERMRTWRVPTVSAAGFLAVLSGWAVPPGFSPNVLRHAAEAAAFIAQSTPPDSQVVASMPELPIAAHREVPRALAMGKFSVTEDLAPEMAKQLHLLTPEELAAIMTDPKTSALAFSTGEKWNFSWSVPNYHFLTNESRALLFATITENYQPAYGNADYVIFLRKNADEARATP